MYHLNPEGDFYSGDGPVRAHIIILEPLCTVANAFTALEEEEEERA